jgi:arylsulfatase A-like enzyme
MQIVDLESAREQAPPNSQEKDLLRANTASFFVSFVSCRIIFYLFFLLTSFWCLLAYVSITYLTITKAPEQTLLPTVFRLQPWLYWPVCLLAMKSVWTDLQGRSRRLTLGLIGFLFVQGVYFLYQQPFSRLGNNGASYLWALIVLFPIVWMAVNDFVACYSAQSWETDRAGRIHAEENSSGFSVSFVLITVLLAAITTLICIHTRYYVVLKQAPPLQKEWFLVPVGIVSQLFAGLVLIALVQAGRSVSFPHVNAEKRRFWIELFCVSLVLIVFFLKVLLKAIMLERPLAWIYAIAVATAMAAALGGLQLRKRMDRSPRQPRRRLTHVEQVGAFIVIGLLDYLVPAFIGNLDWGYLVARLWGIAFAVAIALALYYSERVSRRKVYRFPVLVVFVAIGLGGSVALSHSEKLWMKVLGQRDFSLREALNQYETFDSTLMVGRSFLSGPIEDPCDNFCHFLLENSNLARRRLGGGHFELVDPLVAAPEKKPNIFIIVVDSLRQDYVSAYNPAVDFTPEIQKFANDSVVMRNAFTRYAGTALSEPAIWSGVMQVHMHYVQPYSRLNNLEKLIRVDHYQNYVAMDAILQKILDPATPIMNLDTEPANFTGGYDLCNTVNHAEQLLDQRRSAAPIFFFAQPQNIHLATLQDLPLNYRPRRDYAGFEPKYASELERLDGCFGNFISYLQTRGLYENSIIVLSADHGEAMNEEPHANHSFNLRPEILKIPLIIHLPAGLQKQYLSDPQEIAFATDITPTIYYLLGHTPINKSKFFGRPLFTKTREEQTQYLQSAYLVESSYGPMYGILMRQPQQIYIDDAETYRHRFFDLSTDPKATHNRVNDEIQFRYQQQIRNEIDGLMAFYGFGKEPFSFERWLTH